MKETHKYDDIINLEAPTSKKHKRMSMKNRAAQFAPFAALVGHDEEVNKHIKENADRINAGENEAFIED